MIGSLVRHDPFNIIRTIGGSLFCEGSMRRLSLALISGVSAIAFAQMAAAGDMGRPIYEPLPPPADWSGVSVGVESGYGSGHQSFDPAFNSPTVSSLQGLGGFAGGRKQLGDSLFGVETDIQHR
jgi:opacity protein-like surface antigen